MNCHCNIIDAYVELCKANDIQLYEWRTETMCPRECTVGFEWVEMTPSAQEHCNHVHTEGFPQAYGL